MEQVEDQGACRAISHLANNNPHQISNYVVRALVDMRSRETRACSQRQLILFHVGDQIPESMTNEIRFILNEGLQDHDPDTRAMAITATVRSLGTNAIEFLTSYLSHTSVTVRAQVQEQIKELEREITEQTGGTLRR